MTTKEILKRLDERLATFRLEKDNFRNTNFPWQYHVATMEAVIASIHHSHPTETKK